METATSFAASFLLLLVTAAAEHDTSPWTRGDYGKLTVSADGKSYAFEFSSNGTTTTFASTAGSLANVTDVSEGPASTDPNLGAYDELLFQIGAFGNLSIRYFAKLDVFTFVRQPAASANLSVGTFPSVWPSFSIEAAAKNNVTQCLGWTEGRYGCVGIALSVCLSPSLPLICFLHALSVIDSFHN